jgi:hypothetical protein
MKELNNAEWEFHGDDQWVFGVKVLAVPTGVS